MSDLKKKEELERLLDLAHEHLRIPNKMLALLTSSGLGIVGGTAGFALFEKLQEHEANPNNLFAVALIFLLWSPVAVYATRRGNRAFGDYSRVMDQVFALKNATTEPNESLETQD